MENQQSQTDELNPEQEQQQETVDPQQGNQQEQEQEERLYAGRFKTPEELEDHYKLSSAEGARLAQQVKQLQSELLRANTPQQAEKIQDKLDDLNAYFEPETAKVLHGWHENRTRAIFKEEFANWHKQSQAQEAFAKQVTEVWEDTKKLYPEVSDPKSKLYQRANEILFERNLAQVSGDGAVQLLTPFAYRIAVEAAVAELNRQAPENAQLQTRKTQAGAVQGRGSRVVPKGKLTPEEYFKLSDEAKDAYDQSTMNTQGG